MFVISSAVHFSTFLQGLGVTLRTLFESRSALPLLVIFRGSKSYCRMIMVGAPKEQRPAPKITATHDWM